MRFIKSPLRRFVLVLVCLAFCISFSPATIVAAQDIVEPGPNPLPLTDLQAIYGNWQYWVGTDCASATGSATTVSVTISGNNVQIAFDFFVANGFSTTAAAGIVGNLMYESAGTSGNINPTQGEIGGGGGYGIAQFTGVELTEMEAWVAAQGGNPASLGGVSGQPPGQLDYLLHDLNSSYPTVVSALKTSSSVSDAAQTFMVQYERPQGSNTNPISGDAASSLPDRVSDGQAAYNAYAGSAGSGATTANESCSNDTGTGTAVNCTSATGDAKILCEAEPYAGIYYEYGGGHQGYAAFIAACPNPADPPDNQASGGPSIDGGLSGNPSPCATDCSALVSIAVDAAFGQTFNWVVSSFFGSPDWKPVALNAVVPGDIVTIGTDHVEIVDTYSPGSEIIETFGSHETGTQTGTVTSTLSSWTNAFQYIGPGSTS